jgi:small-conductance mechanosensitive channel
VIAPVAVALALAFAVPAAAQAPPSAADTLLGIAAPQGAARGAEAGVPPGSAAKLHPVPLVFQGVTITTFRAPIAGLSPQERAKTALKRLDSLRPPFDLEKIHDEEIPGGRAIFVGDVLAFAVMRGDLDIRLTQAPEEAVQVARARLAQALEKRASQWKPGYLVWSVAFSLLATVVWIVLLAVVGRVRRKTLDTLAAAAGRKPSYLAPRGFDLSGPVCQTLSVAAQIAAATAVVFATYTWLTFVLNRFPHTEPLGRALRSFMLGIIGTFTTAIFGALPGLSIAVFILLLARGATQLVNQLFRDVERGILSLPGIHPETAQATKRLVTSMLWLFAFVIIYPFLPGSQSDVFKGVSVFVGLLVTLGSSGMVSHMMSGLVLVYSRALRKGDYVRVGDVEGFVAQVGALSTKITNLKNEEFTIPNMVMVSSTVKNFTRLAGETGSPLTTQVTIGYDAPWRVVHDMLTTAAARTPGLRTDPAPFVLQTSLSDFYVEYQLIARLEAQDQRWRVLSKLHQNIQDAFNERGVQIMSPHFEGQPERPVVVPKSRWNPPPSDAPEEGPGGSV